MGCITHLSSNSKCLWYIIMYMNHKWKMAGRGLYWKHIFDNFSVEMIRVSIWNMNIHKFLNFEYFSFKIWRYDTIWKKPTLVFWAYNHLISVKKWFVKLYILAKYISRCIVFQSISLFSVGVDGVNVASVDEF